MQINNPLSQSRVLREQLMVTTRLPLLENPAYFKKDVFLESWDEIDRAFVLKGSSMQVMGAFGVPTSLVLFYSLIPPVGSLYKSLIRNKKLFVYRLTNSLETEEFGFCRNPEFEELFKDITVTRQSLLGVGSQFVGITDKQSEEQKGADEAAKEELLTNNETVSKIVEGGYLLVHYSDKVKQDKELIKVFNLLKTVGVKIVTVNDLFLNSLLESKVSIHDIEAFLYNMAGNKKVSTTETEHEVNNDKYEGALLSYDLNVISSRYNTMNIQCYRRPDYSSVSLSCKFDWFIGDQQIRYYVSINEEVLFDTNKVLLLILGYLSTSTNATELKGRKAYLTEAFVSKVYVGYPHKMLDYHLKRVLGSLDLNVNIYSYMDLSLTKASDSILALRTLTTKYKTPFLPNKSAKWVSVDSGGIGVTFIPKVKELYTLLDDLLTLRSQGKLEVILDVPTEHQDKRDFYLNVLDRVLDIHRDERKTYTPTRTLLSILATMDRELLKKLFISLKDIDLLAKDQWEFALPFDPDKISKLGGRLLALVPTGGMCYSQSFKGIQNAGDEKVRSYLDSFKE